MKSTFLKATFGAGCFWGVEAAYRKVEGVVSTVVGYMGGTLDDTVVRILRQELGLKFSKPYPIDYRRPDDAEALLENQLHLVFMLLKEKGIREDEIAMVLWMKSDLKILRTLSESGVLIESESRKIYPDLRLTRLDSMPLRGRACNNFWIIRR